MTASIPNVERIVSGLVKAEFEYLRKRYGKRGETPQEYHHDGHARDVMNAAKAIANEAIKRGKISARDKQLLIVAAVYHDHEHSLGRDIDEQSSAEAASVAMIQAGCFTADEITNVQQAILGTRVKFGDDGMVYQQAGKNYLAQILADSDLASLGKKTSDYKKISDSLYREYYPGKNTNDPEYKEFVERSVALLKKHRFYTQEARELFPNQPTNLALVKTLL